MIDRGFVRLSEGLVHYRKRIAQGDDLPLLMVHAGPVSSASLEPLIEALPQSRTIYAPDTLGFGDSAAPAPEAPDVAYYADATIRFMDALDLDKVDFYGSHTGANIGCELTIAHPDRVGRLVLEGIGLFDEPTRADLLANYAPRQEPQAYGEHLLWAWHFLRDQSLFYPHYRKDAEHRLSNDVFPTELLHAFTVDVLKALRNYHMGYEAVFRHDPTARLPLIGHEILFLAHDYDPARIYVEDAAKLVPNGKALGIDATGGLAAQAAAMETFLNR